MKKSKILILITRLNNGGAARHVMTLGRLLNNQNREAVLISGKTEGGEDDISGQTREYRLRHITVKHLRRSLHPLFDLLSLFRVYHIIRQERPCLIHTHMSKAGFIGRSAAILYNLFHKKKIKIVHTFHGHVFHSYFSGLKTALFIRLERILAKKTHILIALSEKQEEEIGNAIKIEQEKRKKLRVIPLGVDFKPPEREKGIHSPSDIVNVGMLGRLAPVKNYPLAKKIARTLKEWQIPARITVGGGGSERELRELCSGDDDREDINFLGNIEEPGKFWPGIDLALVTSKNEGTPVSLIEAMLSGIPFVAPQVGGIPDMTAGPCRRGHNLRIYPNAILVKGFEPGDFAKAIHHYCSREARQRAGEAARQFAEKKYSLERLTVDMEKLYKDLLET